MDILDPHEYDSVLQQALCVLVNMEASDAWFSAGDISRILKEEWGLHLHWKTIISTFDKNKESITRRKRDHKWQYSILKKGREALVVSDRGVTLIDPKKAVQHVCSLHDMFSELSGNIYICDPYLDATTLEHLDSCGSGASIFLLSYNIHDTGRLRQLITAYPSTEKQIEIRKTPKAILHDRYIIDKKGMLILGTSLNGYGKKQCFMINAGRDVRSTMLNCFKTYWAEAERWPD